MSANTAPEITLLNGMLGKDFAESLERHQKLGVRLLDLKDSIFGKNFSNLTPDEALAARALIKQHGMEVYTLSSSLCHLDVEQGEIEFRKNVEAEMAKVLRVAPVLLPKSVRLLSAWSMRRAEFTHSIIHLNRHHPWVWDVYRECVDRLFEAGYSVFIENEAEKNILSTPEEISGFFAHLDRSHRVKLTWDIQNLWQMGTFPTVAAYESLRDVIGYLHFKGGQAGDDGKLAWASSLEDASWPVADIVRHAVADGNIPVFCLNPSHGQRKPDYDPDAVTERDILFLRQLIRI